MTQLQNIGGHAPCETRTESAADGERGQIAVETHSRDVSLAKSKNPLTLAVIAALEHEAGNVQLAAKRLEEQVRRKANLRKALLEPLIQYACVQAVTLQVRANRTHIWHPHAVPPNMNGADRVRLLAQDALMRFPLPGGKALADATRDDVSRAASFYESQSKDMGHKGRWLGLIAKSVPFGKIVKDALDEQRLAELRKEAEQ